MGKSLRRHPITLGDHVAKQKVVDGLRPITLCSTMQRLYIATLTFKTLKA